MAAENELKVEEVRIDIQKWYNGYQWTPGHPIYNPWSILNVFDSGRFANYWWDSGTPSFLIKLLRQEFFYDLEGIETSAVAFQNLEIDHLDRVSILFQTGYVTIQGYDKQTRLYTLGFPNQEVKDTMQQHLLGAFRASHATDSLPLLVKIKQAFETGEIEKAIDRINALFETLPYQLFQARTEGFFHAILHLAFVGIGIYVESEVSTAKGRVDCVVQTTDQIYIIEFKLDASAESVLAQIREKRYGSRFLEDQKPIMALGINFSSAEKAIVEWQAMPYRQLLTEG